MEFRRDAVVVPTRATGQFKSGTGLVSHPLDVVEFVHVRAVSLFGRLPSVASISSRSRSSRGGNARRGCRELHRDQAGNHRI
jgi:hypothetical protein